MTQLAPVSPRERMVTLDVLRGFALCGVMLGNMAVFSGRWTSRGGPPPTTLDHVAEWFLDICVHGKAQTLLTFLFGLGFAMQLLRADERGEPVAGFYLRRLGALLVFGALHVTLLWWGDVTWNYAVAGLGLFPFVRASNRTRVAWGLILIFVPHLVVSIPGVGAAAMHVLVDPAVQDGSTPRLMAAVQRAEHAGLWWEHVRYVLLFTARIYAWYFLWVLGRFLLGYVAGQRCWFERDGADHLPVFRRLARWGGAVAVVTNAIEASVKLGWIPLPALGVAGRFAMVIVSETGLLATALFYAGMVVLLIQRSRWRRVLSVVAPVGRMPLTTYAMQSLACTFVFYGWGLGWTGAVGSAGTVAIALGIFTVQIAIAQLWLRWCRFGPFEWLWRAAVYWKVPAMRVATGSVMPRELPAPAIRPDAP